MKAVRTKWIRKSLTLVVGGAVLLCTTAALAELGGDASSVKSDQVKLRGSLRVNSAQAYAVHEIRTEGNGLVREYVSPAGKVFGVTYDGPAIGESSTMLGSYNAQVGQAVRAARGGRHMGGPVIVRVGNVVYEATGHQRSYHVRAYDVSNVPQGTALEEIR